MSLCLCLAFKIIADLLRGMAKNAVDLLQNKLHL